MTRYCLPLLCCWALAGAAPAAVAEMAEGRRLFRGQCGGCHSLQPGEQRAGPSLFGVVGRAAGKLAGYAYSPVLHEADFLWTTDRLDRFLSDPAAMLPGTRMVFWGLDDPARERVIHYLQAVAEGAAE